jgi:hypothetical protein
LPGVNGFGTTFGGLPTAIWGSSEPYTFTASNGNIAITGYTGSSNSITIPSVINGLPVTSIGDYAFDGQTGLTSLTIPNNVISVGNYAFQNCTSLTNWTIGSGVTTIGDEPDYGCTSLLAINVDSQNPIFSSVGGVVFDKTQTILYRFPMGRAGTYSIPNNIINLGPGVFQFCAKLTGVTLPSGVTNVGEYVFDSCAGLTSLTFPNSVVSVGSDAFKNCISLTNVNFGSGITTFGSDVDDGCVNMTAINVDPLNPLFSSVAGVLFDKSKGNLWRFPMGRAGSYSVPNSVTNIGTAFQYCSRLVSVKIPASVINIDKYAFDSCSNLTGIYFKGNAPHLGLTGGVFLNTQFNNDNMATAYYLPGTTGWSTTYGGLPTELWLPQMQTDDGKFGVQANQFGFTIAWTGGQTVVVEASADLVNWHPVQTNTLPSGLGGSTYFSDPQWKNFPGRFYRLHSQ